MPIIISNLNSGSYSVIQDRLYFNNFLVMDRKSALEVTITLLDSVGLLNKNTEDLIELVEDRIEHL